MRKGLFFLTAAMVCLAAQGGFSQSQKDANYSRDEVVRFMVDQADLGRERSVCMGTKSECSSTAKPQPKGFDMMLTFDLDSAVLSDAARKNLDVVAEALVDGRLKAASFRVEGHTDARGGDQYNMTLSTERANAVVRYLEARNVPADKLTPIGLGKTAPRTSDPFDPENRRVELKLATQ